MQSPLTPSQFWMQINILVGVYLIGYVGSYVVGKIYAKRDNVLNEFPEWTRHDALMLAMCSLGSWATFFCFVYLYFRQCIKGEKVKIQG